MVTPIACVASSRVDLMMIWWVSYDKGSGLVGAVRLHSFDTVGCVVVGKERTIQRAELSEENLINRDNLDVPGQPGQSAQPSQSGQQIRCALCFSRET